MKKLYLKLRSGGIHSLGLDIVWQHEKFNFIEAENLGVFDEIECALADGQQGRLIVSALNTTERHIIGEQEVISLKFGWDENAVRETVVFDAENTIAKDSEGNVIGVTVYPADFTPDPNTIEFIWR